MGLTKHQQLIHRNIESEVATWPDWQRGYYRYLRRNKKQSITMAHMLACNEAPRVKSDTLVMSGQRRIKDLPDGYREYLCKEIKANGGAVNPTDVYMSGMAEKFGDPQAVFGQDGVMGNIRRLSEERGIDSEGIVTVKGSKNREEKPARREHQLHPRIVERNRRRMIAENPDLKHADQNELRASIVQKHAYKGE